MTAFHIDDSTGEYTLTQPISAEQLIQEAKEILRTMLARSSDLSFASPSDVRNFLKLTLAPREREIFACMFLDNRHRMIAFGELFQGTIDGASVHPREVVKSALAHNAAAVILAHNHPSGVAEPSQADQRITQRLQEALALVDIRVLDHFVIGAGEPVSFAESGLL